MSSDDTVVLMPRCLLAVVWLVCACRSSLGPQPVGHVYMKDANMKDVTLWYDAFNDRDPARFDKILSADWLDIPSAADQPRGPAGAKLVLRMLEQAFPDFRVNVVEVLRDGDKVVVRSEITGTQRGAFMGSPPTNKSLTIMAIDIHQLENGKIVRTWHTEDWMSGFVQLGLLSH